jgi:hypothetical protein
MKEGLEERGHAPRSVAASGFVSEHKKFFFFL